MIYAEELLVKKNAVDAAYKTYADSAAFKANFSSPEYLSFQDACIAYDSARKGIDDEETLQAALRHAPDLHNNTP